MEGTAACEHSPCFLLEVFSFFCSLERLLTRRGDRKFESRRCLGSKKGVKGGDGVICGWVWVVL